MTTKPVAEMTDQEIMLCGLERGINPNYDLEDAAAFRRFTKVFRCSNLSYKEADAFILKSMREVNNKLQDLPKEEAHELLIKVYSGLDPTRDPELEN